MSLRPCEVRAVRTAPIDRAIEFVAHGHDVHVCQVERPFLAEHVGRDHQCACGVTWAPDAETDNDPITALAARVGLPVERLEKVLA